MAAASTAPGSTVAVTDAGPALKRISINIPAARVTEQIDSQFGTLASQAAIPGFRAGRVPRALLEKRFGKAVLDEAKQALVSEAFSKAVEEHKLRPVGRPELSKDSADAPLASGQPFTLLIDVEVVPEFALPAWEGIALKRPVIDITDTHINDEIRRSSYRYGTPNPIEGPFQPLDRCVGRAVVHLEGQETVFFETDQALAVVPEESDKGKGVFLGLAFEGLDVSLGGRKVGDTLQLETVGPEAHELEAVRGKKLKIEYAIRQAERITPATPEELAAKVGTATVELLREQVKMVLERRRDEEQRAALREQVFETLGESVDFVLPERMSAAQAERDLERARLEMLYRGVEEKQVEARLADMRGASADQTKRRLKLFFVLARLAETLNVEASEAEVNGRIASIARSRNQRPDVLRAELEKSGRLGEIALQIREHKAADRVIAKATVSDVPAEEWNAQVEQKTRKGTTAAAAGKTNKSKAKGD